MIRELHGKWYYIAVDNYDDIGIIMAILSKKKSLKNEIWRTIEIGDGKWVVASTSRCESFRGIRYHEWESAKAKYYLIKSSRRIIDESRK